VKFVPTLLAAAAFLVTSPALAQGPSGHYDAGFASEPDTQALAFIRIPIGESRAGSEPRIGFGLFTDCTRMAAGLSQSHRSACESQPIRSLEFSRDLYDRDWLFSFSGTKRWVGIARWHPGSGFARVRENGPVLGGPSLQGPPDWTVQARRSFRHQHGALAR
jgi:hypothetical protein